MKKVAALHVCRHYSDRLLRELGQLVGGNGIPSRNDGDASICEAIADGQDAHKASKSKPPVENVAG